MDRTTVARSRVLLSLLVVGILLAVAAAPAGLASVDPGIVAANGRPTVATPAPIDLAVAAPAATPGATAIPVVVMPSPPSTDPPKRPSSPSPGTATACAPVPAGLHMARVVSHGPRVEKVVALTFDDGYGATNTMKILSILERSHVNATFLPTGRAVLLYPGVWKQVVQAGFPIADHTYDHRRLKGMCFAGQLRELERQQDVIEDKLGISPIAVMRPPYGAYDTTTKFAAYAAHDRAVMLWDVDTKDWSGIGPWTVARRALAGRQGSIVLMHTFSRATAAALPRIIAGYRARGFEFMTVGQLLGIDGPVPFS